MSRAGANTPHVSRCCSYCAFAASPFALRIPTNSWLCFQDFLSLLLLTGIHSHRLIHWYVVWELNYLSEGQRTDICRQNLHPSHSGGEKIWEIRLFLFAQLSLILITNRRHGNSSVLWAVWFIIKCSQSAGLLWSLQGENSIMRPKTPWLHPISNSSLIIILSEKKTVSCLMQILPTIITWCHL